MSAFDGSGPTGGGFAHALLTAPGRHAVRRVGLPAPFHSRYALEVAHDERAWLGPIAEGRAVRTLVSFAERPLGVAFATLALLRATPLLPKRPFVRARVTALSEEALVEWVAARRGGRDVERRWILARGDYRSTAAAAAAELAALRARPLPPGVRTIEQALRFADVGSALGARGIEVVRAA